MPSQEPGFCQIIRTKMSSTVHLTRSQIKNKGKQQHSLNMSLLLLELLCNFAASLKEGLLIFPISRCRRKLWMSMKFFAENFTIILFHYDGEVDGWRDLDWCEKAVHVVANNQRKCWNLDYDYESHSGRTEGLPHGIMQPHSDLELMPQWSRFPKVNITTSKNLLAMAVGIKQKVYGLFCMRYLINTKSMKTHLERYLILPHSLLGSLFFILLGCFGFSLLEPEVFKPHSLLDSLCFDLSFLASEGFKPPSLLDSQFLGLP